MRANVRQNRRTNKREINEQKHPRLARARYTGGSAHRPARSIEFLFYRFFMVAAAMIVYSAIACNLFNARGYALCLYFCHQSGIRYALFISDTLSAARVQRGRLAAGHSVRLRYKQCSSYRQPAHFAHPPGCGGTRCVPTVQAMPVPSPVGSLCPPARVRRGVVCDCGTSNVHPIASPLILPTRQGAQGRGGLFRKRLCPQRRTRSAN